MEETPDPVDPQRAEIQVREASKAAQAQLGAALAKDVQANQDRMIEAEQLGKEPYARWYSGSQNQVGFNLDKGIADMLFLSLFGHSSATDTKRTKLQRAILRTILTVAVAAILGLIYQLLTADSFHQTHTLFK
ncbi:MAG TPA: hypothetical protein VF401_04860 [Candidatus Saccharimonadales bacterium]